MVEPVAAPTPAPASLPDVLLRAKAITRVGMLHLAHGAGGDAKLQAGDTVLVKGQFVEMYLGTGRVEIA